MLLHEGIMTNAELAEWFGVSLKTFTSFKKKKLEYLSNFCKFEDLKGTGKIHIIEIWQAEYTKPSSKAMKYIADNLYTVWQQEGGFNTTSYVAPKLNKYGKSENTVLQYTRQQLKEQFGPAHNNVPGTKGWRESCFGCAVKDGIPVLLTKEELAKVEEIHKAYFNSKITAAMRAALDEGSMDAEDLKNEFQNRFKDFRLACGEYLQQKHGDPTARLVTGYILHLGF